MPPIQTRQASIATINRQDIFRLFQEVESSGDIFEIDTGVKGIAVGPDSDLADFRVFYYDAQLNPNRVNELAVSVGNPHKGRLDSLNVTEFPTQGQPARLTLATRDLIRNDYLPVGFDPVGPPADTIVRFRPKLDVLCYLANAENLPQLRSDRVYNINNFVGAVGAQIFFVFPYYGRRQVTVAVSNFSSGGGAFDLPIQMRGVRLGLGTVPAPSGVQRNQETMLTATPIVVPASSSRQIISRASDDGQFDLVVVQASSQGVLSQDLMMDVIMSDEES